jgi:hypothetical protein
MRITESTLKRIIREEARRVLGTGSLRINESDFEDEEEDDFDDEDTDFDDEDTDEEDDFDDEDADDEEDDFDDDGKKYPGEGHYSPDELDQLAADAEEDRQALDADEEDFDEEANIPGMTGETDEYYIAAQIVDQLGDNAAQDLYNDCMYNSNPNADYELEDYIEDFGGGLFDGSDEDQQMKVLRAIAHTLRGLE